MSDGELDGQAIFDLARQMRQAEKRKDWAECHRLMGESKTLVGDHTEEEVMCAVFEALHRRRDDEEEPMGDPLLANLSDEDQALVTGIQAEAARTGQAQWTTLSSGSKVYCEPQDDGVTMHWAVADG